MAARTGAFLAGYAGGLGPGVLRGGKHAIEGLYEGAVFAGRVANPQLDQLLSPTGQTAGEQVASGLGHWAQEGGRAALHPRAALQRAQRGLAAVNRAYNPFSTPLPPTTDAAYQRGTELGLNDGELAFNVAATAAGGEVGEALEGAKYLSEAGDVAKYVRAGHPLDVAEHLAQPYEGMGHHAWGRKRELPPGLGGGTLPEWLLESKLNRLQPRGIDRGQMYKLHFEVDPKFHGAKLPRRGKGQGWSGRRLGLEKLGPDGQIWNGVPGYTKGVATGAILDLGAGLHRLLSQDQPQ